MNVQNDSFYNSSLHKSNNSAAQAPVLNPVAITRTACKKIFYIDLFKLPSTSGHCTYSDVLSMQYLVADRCESDKLLVFCVHEFPTCVTVPNVQVKGWSIQVLQQKRWWQKNKEQANLKPLKIASSYNSGKAGSHQRCTTLLICAFRRLREWISWLTGDHSDSVGFSATGPPWGNI